MNQTIKIHIEKDSTHSWDTNRFNLISELLLQLLVTLSSLQRRERFIQSKFYSCHCMLVTIYNYVLLGFKTQHLTLHLVGSQAVNHPVKVGGSNPCLMRTTGVSGSLFPGWVRRYSWLVTTASLRSSSLASFPIQRVT